MKRTNLDELITTLAPKRADGATVVLANGVFDLLHVGHLRYLEAAKQHGDVLVVAVNSDASTRAYKGPDRPVVPEDERAELIGGFHCVDHVLVFDEPNVERILQALQPNVHAKGTDYTTETVPERVVVESYGGQVAICGDPKDHSSTALITATAGDPALASVGESGLSSAPMSTDHTVARITEIADRLDELEGQDVEIRGWLYAKRSSGKLHFLQVRDGSATLQCVMSKKNVSEEAFDAAKHLTQESAIIVRGTVKRDARSSLGFEVGVADLDVVHVAETYPISPKDHGVGFLMDNRHLWLRSSRQHKIIRIRHTIIKAIRDYFDDNDFTLVDTPVFTPNACEGTSTLFTVPYFETQAYLTQSGQLYNEAAAMAHGKVYCFGPTFRAEKSKTRRHLTEFWMVEPEVAYLTLEENMDLAEDFLCFIVERVLAKHTADLEELGRDLEPLKKVQKPFPRLRHDEAVALINEAIDSGTADASSAGSSEGDEDDAPAAELTRAALDDDFGAAHETVLTKLFDRPVMVHRYPYAVKAFYMKRDPADAGRALCVDVLAPEGYGEIIGGGQREDDLDALLGRIDAHELSREDFQWFTDLRRYGSVPHGGFGLGVERTVAWICGLHHVRETAPFARTIDRLSP